MGDYRPKKWPTYALGSLEDSRKLLGDMRTAIRTAQEAVLAGDRDLAIILLADIRESIAQVDELLAGAYTGDYKR